MAGGLVLVRMTNYVLGFLFDPKLEAVVLIEKRRPGWQAGKHNGVGGKIEGGEVPHEAMVREFREETGLDIPEWKQFATLPSPTADFVLNVFFAISPDYDKVTSITDEEVVVWEIDSIELWRDNFIPNVRWLIQMALSFTKGERATAFTITETY